MAKPTKPEWATGDPSYIIEPGAPKKATGWLSGEKPPYQYMNWIHYTTDQWIDYFENITEVLGSILVKSSATATWNGADLVFASPIDMCFRVEGGEQINRFAAGTISLADGECVVVNLDRTTASPVVLAAGTYGTLAAGQYDIIDEDDLTGDDWENEVILLRRRGTDLEIQVTGDIFETGVTIDFGKPSPSAHVHSAADITTGTLAVARGGTNIGTYAVGDIIQASGATTLAALAAVATGNVLISGGVGTVSSWGKVTTSHITGTTGSGDFVLATSPALTTPNIGTPSAGTLTSCTGLPISTGVSGLASGAATFLATPSSANLRSLLTDETGSGAAVFAGSPSLTTPTIAGAVLSGTLSGTHTVSGAVTYSGTVLPPSDDSPVANSLYQQSLTRVWAIADITAASTGTLDASYNVSGFSVNADGDPTFTFDTNFTSTDFAYAGMSGDATDPVNVGTRGTGSISLELGTGNTNWSATLIAIGDQ